MTALKLSCFIILYLLGEGLVFSQSVLDSLDIFEERIWHEAGYKNPKISKLDTKKWYKGSDYSFTHYMDVTLINLKGSGWSLAEIDTTMKQVAEIYSKQCQIHIRKAKIIESDSPINKVHLNEDINKSKDEKIKLNNLAPVKERPLFYFVKSLSSGNVGRALTPKEEDKDNSPFYSTFMTNEVNQDSFKRERLKGYSPIAHELMHLLCRCDHTFNEEISIISDDYLDRTNKIPSSLCKSIKDKNNKSPFLKKYPKPLELKKNDT